MKMAPLNLYVSVDILDKLVSACYDLCDADPQFEAQLFEKGQINHDILMDEEWFANSTELERHMYSLELAMSQDIACGFIMKNYGCENAQEAWEMYDDLIWEFIDINGTMLKYLFGAYFVSDLIGKIPNMVSDKLQ